MLSLRGRATRRGAASILSRSESVQIRHEVGGDVAQGRFLGRNEFLREFAAALGDFRETGEETAIFHGLEKDHSARWQGGSRPGKNVDLALHAIVNLHNALPGLFFVFAVLHQQPGDGCT